MAQSEDLDTSTNVGFWSKADIATDLEASRERLATCCQPNGNREGPTLSFCKYRKKRKPPIMLAWLG